MDDGGGNDFFLKSFFIIFIYPKALKYSYFFFENFNLKKFTAMNMFKYLVKTKEFLADTITPVSIYMKIRELYPESFLLESSDYRGNENSFSFVCINPVAHYVLDNFKVVEILPDKSVLNYNIDKNGFKESFRNFINRFQILNTEINIPANGFFGYVTYDAVKYFENISFNNFPDEAYKIPDLKFTFFKVIIAINHFKNTLYIIENCFLDNYDDEIDKIEYLLTNLNIKLKKFDANDDEYSTITDEDYKNLVKYGKKHCYRGDVFQIVLSRRFARTFKGDDFNVYRALRSINPSPYLFYFDYGDFHIFGSSPETQIKVKENRAYINPIAGTFRRTGNDENDKEQAKNLSKDPKENAEHVMLVDLARNDLSRYGTDVRVERFKEIQFYSHVIHMVSTVSAQLYDDYDCIDMLTATFPAGTLSGAPKFKAMELIDKYEKQARGYYGGAIGYIGIDGSLNMAIMIRTFLSKNNILYYQAGAGIVADSLEENELQEVNNKLGALKKAIEMASKL